MRLGLFNLVNNEYSDIVVATSPVVKSDQISGIIESIIIEGVLSDPVYVKPEGSFYWSRRSYSSHLWFNIPTKEPLNAFYTELTLPTGWDTQGAYFMTNGWSVGYSGFQTADRVLISVWSPYDTNDPKSIPADCTVQIMQLGVGIKPNVFGG